MSQLYKKYQKEIVPSLTKELNLSNAMQAPKVVKVVLNVGVGKFVKESNFVENVEKTLLRITGQKPVRTRAKKSISNFKVRENMEIGVMVTLRGKRMYDFLEKLINVTFARMRDFHGITDKGFDKRGNFSLGLNENSAFPEIKAGEVDKMHGLQATIVTTAKNKEQGRALLTHLGFPFIKK